MTGMTNPPAQPPRGYLVIEDNKVRAVTGHYGTAMAWLRPGAVVVVANGIRADDTGQLLPVDEDHWPFEPEYKKETTGPEPDRGDNRWTVSTTPMTDTTQWAPNATDGLTSPWHNLDENDSDYTVKYTAARIAGALQAVLVAHRDLAHTARADINFGQVVNKYLDGLDAFSPSVGGHSFGLQEVRAAIAAREEELLLDVLEVVQRYIDDPEHADD